MNEGIIQLPGTIQKDESMNMVHFLNNDFQKRRMIVSRELLPINSDFQEIVNGQVQELKNDKIMTVDDFRFLGKSEVIWPAAIIDACAAMGNKQVWQFHVSLHWELKFLITLSLNSEEKMHADEKIAWLQSIKSLEFDT